MTTFNIRQERAEDRTEIAKLIARTYMGAGARTIEVAGRLREISSPDLSFVAEKDGEAKAFALFTPLAVKGCDDKTLLLSPIAIDTLDENIDVQKFLEDVLTEVKKKDYTAVVVHGTEEMYGAYGFKNADVFKLKSEVHFDNAEFMVLPLKEVKEGEVIYPDFLKS